MKSILIATYVFYPEINPRAFRAFELAKEFSKRGYKVDVVIPSINYDYSELEKEYGMKIHLIPSGFFLNKDQKLFTDSSATYGKSKMQSSIKKILKNFMNCIYLGGKTFEYAFTLYHYLKRLPKKYDTVISISFPISVHLGIRWFIKKTSDKVVSIADSGDPFSFNPGAGAQCFYFKMIEKYILAPFDYVTIPTASALNIYQSLKDPNAIKVIPQSFDAETIKIKEYRQHFIPTFGYAGIFYPSIRNPKILFDFLLTLKHLPFKFIIYTNIDNADNMELLAEYKKILKDKLVLHHLIPREQCIYELSGMDFIINQNNLNSEQKPSKMIDYMLTKRPIFTFDQNNLDTEKLLAFLQYKFGISTNHDEFLSDYSITTVANNFEKLMNKTN